MSDPLVTKLATKLAPSFEGACNGVQQEIEHFLLPVIAEARALKPAELTAADHEAIHRVNQALERIPRAL